MRLKRILQNLMMIALLAGSFLCTPSYAAEHQHVWSEWEVIERPSCEETGIGDRQCTVCGKIERRAAIPKSSHIWGDWEITQKASHYRKGKKIRECRWCGKIQKKSIPRRNLTKAETKARDTAEKYLKAAKRYDLDTLYASFPQPSSGVLYGLLKGEKEQKYLRKYNKKYLKWKIQEIEKLPGSSTEYTVTVKVTRPDFYSVLHKKYYKETLKAKKEAEETGNPYPDQVKIKSQALLKAYDTLWKKLDHGYKKTKTETIPMYVCKEKGAWKVAYEMKYFDIAAGDYNKVFWDVERELKW